MPELINALSPGMTARRLRRAALELLAEVNRLEREYPETFPDFQGREWHIARYEEVESRGESHPEATCEECGGPNVTWFATSDLWNLATDNNRLLVLCPICFVRRAEALGVRPTAWVLKPEETFSAEDHRVWLEDIRAWRRDE